MSPGPKSHIVIRNPHDSRRPEFSSSLHAARRIINSTLLSAGRILYIARRIFVSWEERNSLRPHYAAYRVELGTCLLLRPHSQQRALQNISLRGQPVVGRGKAGQRCTGVRTRHESSELEMDLKSEWALGEFRDPPIEWRLLDNSSSNGAAGGRGSGQTSSGSPQLPAGDVGKAASPSGGAVGGRRRVLSTRSAYQGERLAGLLVVKFEAGELQTFFAATSKV